MWRFMALIKKQDKDQNGKKPPTRGESDPKKKEGAKKLAPRSDKRPVAVKKETVNRLDRSRKYFRGVYSELKKVHWPTRKEVITYTAVVVVAVIIVALMIWVFDSLLSKVLQLFIR